MAFNGSGTFLINSTGQPVVTGTVISSTVFNALTNDLATGLSTTLTKDGQSTPTANIPMGGFKLTGLGAPTTAGDAIRFDASLTGVIKGTAGVFSVATVGTDYVAPGTATTFTAKQTFNGTSSVLAMKLLNAIEKVTISATAATGTINYDVTTQSVLYYTTSAAANWTVNLRASSGTTMDTALATDESVTLAFLVTQGATPYYNNVVQVDGTTSGVTTKWQNGAPTSGVASGIDIYQYTVIKTGSAAFTVIASLVSAS